MNRLFRKTLMIYDGLWPKKRIKPPYHHVNQIGDPVLRVKCEPVPPATITSTEIKKIITAMRHVIKQYDLVGLAAPQIGINKRIIMMEVNKGHLSQFPSEIVKEQQMTLFPQVVFINPTMKVVNMNKVSFDEACASVRGYHAIVPRYQAILLSGYSEEGKQVSINFSGFVARIAQHEIDHIDGKIFTDVMDRNTFKCSLWNEVNKYGGKIKLPYTGV